MRIQVMSWFFYHLSFICFIIESCVAFKWVYRTAYDGYYTGIGRSIERGTMQGVGRRTMTDAEQGTIIDVVWVKEQSQRWLQDGYRMGLERMQDV